MAEEKTSIISTPPSADSKNESHTPLLVDSSEERHSDEERASIQGLERALGENSRAQTEVLELFKSFYGELEALSWFKRVKANYPQYSDDNRPIFKMLSDLEHEGRRLKNDLVLAKKRAEYSSMSLEELTDTVMKMEARLLKAEITLKQRSNNLAGKHLFVAGGLGSSPCNSIDLDSGGHVQVCELHTARIRPAVVAIGRRVYVAGGMIQNTEGGMTQTGNPDVWSKAFEVYDYVLERCDILPDMPQSLSSITGCSHGSNVIIWGMAGNNISSTFAVRMYDTSQRTWETIPSPPLKNPPVSLPFFGYIGNYLYSKSSGSTLSFFDLDHPNPHWQQENSKIHKSLDYFLPSYVSSSEPLHRRILSNGILSNGTELAIPYVTKMTNSSGDDAIANFGIWNSKTGLFSTLQGDGEKKMIAFANNVAVLSEFPPWHNFLCILILSSQAKKFVPFTISTHYSSAAIVDLNMGVTNDDKSGEDSPS